MNRVVLIDYYTRGLSNSRDPVTIATGLSANGFDVTLVSRSSDPPSQIEGLPVIGLGSWFESLSIKNLPDCVIAISRFDKRLSPVIEVLQGFGVPVILKGDTDGTLGYPLIPNFLRAVSPFASFWNMLVHAAIRLLPRVYVKPKLYQISMANAVVFESPLAGSNISAVMCSAGSAAELDKLELIPNSLAESFFSAPAHKKIEQTISVVAVGRWLDRRPKGTDLLEQTCIAASQLANDMKFTFVGEGSKDLAEKLKNASGRDCFEAVEWLTSEELAELYRSTHISLVTSRVESFSLSAAEALCCGNSIVSTPLEPLYFLCQGGRTGSVAKNFSSSAIVGALMHEVALWRKGERDSLEIANYWQGELSRDTIDSRWKMLVEGEIMGRDRG